MEAVYKPRAFFHTEFGPEFMKRVEDTIKTELGYTDEELENLEILTWDDLVVDYEEAVKAMIGDEAWEKIGYYIDIEEMIRSDVISGYITEIKVGEWTLYVKEW